MAKSPANELICNGSAWGALENDRRNKAGEDAICPHLDFGKSGEEQEAWSYLLENGRMEEKNDLLPPQSWMLQDEWTDMIEKAPDCHEKFLHLSAIYLAKRNLRDGREAIEKALSYKETPTALFIRSQVERLSGDDTSAAKTALYALSKLKDDVSLARQTLSMALSAKLENEIISTYGTLSEKVKADGRVSMYFAYALLRTGKTDEAEKVLMKDGGLSVTDIREGEVSITGLYLEIAEKRAKDAGLPFDPAEVDVPEQFDFRMGKQGRRAPAGK